MIRNTEILKNFVVFEGLDGSGTTTQLDLLNRRLETVGIPRWCTREPTRGVVGRLIREVLSGGVSCEPATLAYLFGADRWEHVFGADGVRAHVEAGEVVASDRYFFSSLAYQSIDVEYDIVDQINGPFPLPEILFFLDVPADVCAERISTRRNVEIFETLPYQTAVDRRYREVLDRHAGHGMQVFVLDGTEDQQKIADHIWNEITKLPIFRT